MTVALDTATTAHGLFSLQAQKTPDACALSLGTRRLTYSALDRWSNRIARKLKHAGVAPGSFVGVLLQRSPEAVATMLGILKAGAAYVPFDPAYPEALLSTLASDCTPSVVIAEPELARAAKWLSGTEVIDDLDATGESEAALDVTVGENDPAYVMYTSGSTGRPKGVVVPHRAIVRLVRKSDFIDFGADQVFLQLAPLAFDASTLEIWGPLLNGGRLAVLPAIHPSLDDIASAIRDEGVTTLWLTAGLFQLMVDHRLEALAPLRQLISGGDVLSPTHVLKALERLPACRIVNGYGPTENTVFTCCYPIPRDTYSGGAVPIGWPIGGTTVQILDDDMQPVSSGLVGQLATGGEGIALFYLNQPELTAERFIPDADLPGEHLYLTGDLACQNPDGSYMFLGRADRQVKISGKRVELGEIEESLRTDPTVADAAVLLREDRPGIKRLAAYLIPTSSAPLDTRGVTDRLRARLPEHMIPADVIVLDRFPLTPNGKLDRAGLPAPRPPAATLGSRSQRERELAAIWSEVLGVPAVGRHDNFFDLGGTSLQLVAMHARVQAIAGTRLDLVELFGLPTIADLAHRLSGMEPATPRVGARSLVGTASGAIAVIGLSGRFPGANSVAAFWNNLSQGVESIRRFNDDELDDYFPASVRAAPNYVKARPIIDAVDQFDAKFFGMTPRESALTDPQARVLLECAWEALEDAGYVPETYLEPIAVFAGCSQNTYFLNNVCANRQFIETYTSDFQLGSYTELVGSGEGFLATRISYKLGLTGPSMTVQSACSTSLLAIAQACQALRLGQASMALAGGVSISFPQQRGYLSQEGGMASADGSCRPFDAAASGTVFGSGAGMALLKRLEDAIADGDTVYAVVRGIGISNDGNAKLAFTAPSVDGQAAAIMAAHADSGVDPGTITYVECHGTATPLGDPIEFSGLSKSFAGHVSGTRQIALGSVKSNIGHLDAAAGVAGFIKTALALHHGEIPGTLHFQTPNPRLGIETSPFFVSAASLPWHRSESPRRAGISAFGVGGTNVHLVLEEAPEVAPAETTPGYAVLPLSARTEAALGRLRTRLADHLEATPDLSLNDVAFTLQTGRRAFEQRVAIVAQTRDEAIAGLRQSSPAIHARDSAPPVVFMFPGQGAQHPDMGRSLYDSQPVYREQVDLCAEILKPHLGLDLRAILYGHAADAGDAHPILATVMAQPALFVTEYAMARLWMSWGVTPSAMLGHSIGEFVAACLAGVLTLEDALTLVAARGRLMQGLPPGGMLAVRLNEAELRPLLGSSLDLAAINAPTLCVAAGPFDALAELEATLTAQGTVHRRLHTSHAFHSSMMDPAVTELAKIAAAAKFQPPRIPYVSGVSGNWITEQEATSPDYWARHCRDTVRFADAIRTAAEAGHPILLEVGPGRTLATLSAQTLARGTTTAILTSLSEPGSDQDERQIIAESLGRLWAVGGTPDWARLHPPGTAGRVSLPTYPFERQRHWIDPPPATAQGAAPVAITMLQPATLEETPATAEVDAPAAATAEAAVQAKIVTILENLSGETLTGIDPATSFLEMGFDSLFLGQVAQQIQNVFGIKITFRQLLGDIPTLAALTDHVVAHAAPDKIQGTAKPAAPRATAAAAAASAEAAQDSRPSRIQIYKPSNAAIGREMTPKQQQHLDDLIARYVAKMPGSKAETQKYRAVLADPRAASGFRAEWKEMVFPVVAERAKGSRIWDSDGNEYIDVVNGFGQTAFGHSPDFVVKAVAEQLEIGFPIGPQTPLAGEVAELFSEMTGNERVTFCNTGSEAVMAALRIARTVTGRKRVVIFGGAYHGQFDEVLVKGSNRDAERRALPVAPGIPNQSVENMVVLPYGTPESLEWVRERADDLAAVVVETVQSRHPALLPRQFLADLREITTASGTALVLDEVVTGFRVHPGGMQALLGIRADLATYGKVVGGGMPIGILAGVPRFMDALDGGQWQFGDDSIPEVAPTFFAGTFVRHPLVLAAVKAVLLHMREEGPALQENLTRRTAILVDELNDALAERGFATRIERFSSFFYFSFVNETPWASLLYAHLRLRGIHIQEGFPCFITTAHSEADMAALREAFLDSIDAMIEGEILEPVAALIPLSEAPLTEPQQEIWLSAQFGDDASCAFNESVSIDLDGTLDQAALNAALNDVVARHDAMRAYFGVSGELMSIRKELKLTIPVIETDDAGAKAAIAEDARTPFDLADGPLVRATLLRLAGTRHRLIFTAHHIVCDGWSINVILDELASCYSARLGGMRAVLPAPLPFSRYAVDQAAQVSEGSETEAYWLAQFKDIPAPLELPSDRRRPVFKSFRGATCKGEVDAELYRAVKKTAAKSGATLFAMLFAAFQTLIGRLANQNDIVVAVPTAGQSLVEDKILVGHCVNFLPLRAPFALETPFIDHLQAAKTAVMGAMSHQDYTFGTLVRKLALARDPNRLPLAEVQFNLEKLGSNLDMPGLSAIVAPNPKAFSNFDLFFNVIESNDGLRIDCDFNTDLFDAETISRWIGHYRTLLSSIVADPAQAIGALSLLDPEQRRMIVEDWNDTAADYPHNALVHHLIDTRAGLTPDAPAITYDGQTLSYRELENRANRLAHHLRRRVPGHGARIAVALDRSLDLPVALLAVWKAGHAYVPLDPFHPPSRLRLVLDTAQVSALICADDQMAALAPPGSIVIRLDRDVAALKEEPATPPPSLVGDPATTPAYIIFTSGSTGTPKGVEVAHGSVVNFLLSMARSPGITAMDRLLAVTTISFDIAGLEIFLPLITGAQVEIASLETVKDGFALLDLLRSSQATLLQATPSLWRMLLEAGFAAPSGFKILCGGEPLPGDLAASLVATGAEVWNLYGPTETTIWSTTGKIDPGFDLVTVGMPIANTQIHVLDPFGNVVPPGVSGDLVIGGDGLALGYFARADLTQTAFPSLTIGGNEARRFYRTGDLGRRLADGRIVMLGRGDQQIKLRGFRIELEEIEAVLRRHGGIVDAAVALRTDAGGIARLVGFYVQDPAHPTTPAALTGALAAHLPDYMIPALWVALDVLPLTANGKLDRRALPTVVDAAATRRGPVKAPGTETERIIAAVWKEVLNLDEVGTDEALFSLGADSIHLFRIAAALARRGVPLEAKHLLRHPTIGELAVLVDTRTETQSSNVPSLSAFRRGRARNT